MKEYRKAEGLNQSLLIALSKGIGSYKKEKDLYYEEKPHFDIGEAVDIKLTRPNIFDQVFYVSDELATKPGKGSLSIVKEVYDTALRTYPDDVPTELTDRRLDSFIINASINQEYGGSTWTEDRIYNDIISKGSSYYDALISSKGRNVLSTKQVMLVDSLVEKFRNCSFTAWLFDYGLEPGVERVYQEPLFSNYRDHTIKGLLDMMLINHNERDIDIGGRIIPARSILPVDIKTLSGSVKAFPRSSKERRYDVQGAWYSLLCRLNYPGYQVLPFLFAVVSTTTNEYPLIYEMSNTDLRIARWGGWYKYGDNGRYVKACHSDKVPVTANLDILGFEQMIDLYEWHELNGEWEFDKYIIENFGVVKLEQWI